MITIRSLLNSSLVSDVLNSRVSVVLSARPSWCIDKTAQEESKADSTAKTTRTNSFTISTTFAYVIKDGRAPCCQ